jgi:hypothetical protein
VDWLPMFAALVVAGNKIIEPIPGFTLYNISDGILATDLFGWFVRWLLCQDLEYFSSLVIIKGRKQRLES